jgi:hypothetical protein
MQVQSYILKIDLIFLQILPEDMHATALFATQI